MFGFLSPKVPQIEAAELKSAIDNGENCVILDVRTKGEFEKGSIKGSVNVPIDLIETRIKDIVLNKEIKIYVYCLSGSRSAAAVASLLTMGYTNVFDVRSGVLGWRGAGYALGV